MNRFKSLLNQFKNIQVIDCQSIDLLPQPLFPSSEIQSTIIRFSHWTQNQMLEVAASGRFQVFLNTNGQLADSELFSSLHIQSNPKEFLLSDPIPFWFQNDPTKLVLSFRKKSEKFELMRHFEPFLEQTESRLVQENARLLFQELFMNAAIDAPREAKKHGIAVDGQKESQMIFAYDHEKFVLSCFDPYGALDPQAVVVRIHQILSKENINILNFDRKKGGAGIGSSLLFRYSSTLSLVVEEGKGTRVSCTIPLKIGQKKFDLLEKNLQFIKIPPQGELYEKQRNA